MGKIKLLFHREDGIRVSSPFGLRTSPITKKQEGHRGVDYSTGGRKLPQYAIDDGKVISIGKDETGALFALVCFDKIGYVGQYYHLDSIAVRAGQVVNSETIIGYTGTTGNSTGIHLHFGWFPIEDLKITYTKRRWTDFESFDLGNTNIELKKEEIIMKDGFQKIDYKGNTIYLYKQHKDEEIGLISAGAWKELKRIDKFDKKIQDNEISCMVNASYFIMAGGNRGQVLGREQSFTKDERPEQMEWLDLVIDKTNKIISGNFAGWEYPKSDIKLGLSYACCVLKDGYASDEYSSAVGLGKLTNKNTQTLLMKNNECFYFAVIRGQMNGTDCRKFAKDLKMDDCYMLDSGGSSQMITSSDDGYITGRELPNVLCFYKKGNEMDIKKEEDKEIKVKGKITVHRIGMNIRSQLLFSNRKKPIGTIVGVVKSKETIEVVDMVEGLQIDGFQWVKVKYGKGIAFCQYDSTSYSLELY